MAGRGDKRPRDLNRLAAAIVEEATGETPERAPDEGSLVLRESGARGGNARARKLTPSRRSEIARNAALARWQKKK